MPDCSASTGCWKKRGADRQGCSRLTDLGERHRFFGRLKKDAGQWQWPVRRLFFWQRSFLKGKNSVYWHTTKAARKGLPSSVIGERFMKRFFSVFSWHIYKIRNHYRESLPV